MRRFSILALTLILGALPTAGADEKDAKTIAQEFLDKGATLFDRRDWAALAATYHEDAQIDLVSKDESTGDLKSDVKKGRAEIEAFYQDIFKNNNEATTSKNTVEYARLVTSDMMIIHGTFQPDTTKELKIAFVQMRTRKDDKWILRSLQLYAMAKE
jgi:hypothetical protein